MTYLEAINAIIEQFGNKCAGCDHTCQDCGSPDICETEELYCKDKLIQTAEELDGDR